MSELKAVKKNNEKACIDIENNLKFEGDMKTNIISTMDMADIISSLFSPVFSDYCGCRICVNDGKAVPAIRDSMPIGTLYVDLFFKDQGEASKGMWKNINLTGTNDNGHARTDLGYRFQMVNGRQKDGRMYDVTKATFEVLEEFMLTGSKTKWNSHVFEATTSMSVYGKEEVVVCISGVNLNKIVTKIYGEKTEDGRYEYITSPSTVIPSKPQEFILQVCQLDLAAVRNLQNSLGIYSADAPQYHKFQR